jgi:hypothetical protein
MRAILMDSEMIDRTRGLLFCISFDSTRASLTAAPDGYLIAESPLDLSRGHLETERQNLRQSRLLSESQYQRLKASVAN